MKRFENYLSLQNRNVNDIDLYAGGLSEKIVVGDGLQEYAVGSTFACILMDQFANIKKSDRFYYENDPTTNAGAFSLDQLNQIRNVTLSGLICNNYDILKIQKQPFYYPSNT